MNIINTRMLFKGVKCDYKIKGKKQHKFSLNIIISTVNIFFNYIRITEIIRSRVIIFRLNNRFCENLN